MSRAEHDAHHSTIEIIATKWIRARAFRKAWNVELSRGRLRSRRPAHRRQPRRSQQTDNTMFSPSFSEAAQARSGTLRLSTHRTVAFDRCEIVEPCYVGYLVPNVHLWLCTAGSSCTLRTARVENASISLHSKEVRTQWTTIYCGVESRGNILYC